MFLSGLATAVPSTRYRQLECWQALQGSKSFNDLKPRSRVILEKVLSASNGIDTRSLALENLEEVFENTPDVLHQRFAKHAPQLATAAAQKALAGAGLRSEEVDAVVISTCTGYLCPGLTSYVTERLGLRSDVLPLDLVGQGCGAALPNLRTGQALIESNSCQTVLSVCVEVCSAAFYLDDDPGVLISACLFSDGAGAAVLTREPRSVHGRKIEWRGYGSFTEPADRDLLRFEQRDGKLRNILSLRVPQTAAKHVSTLLNRVLETAGVKKREISEWIFHAGGRDVLDALGKTLDLTARELNWSAGVLREHGNLSSPFVYFVLENALKGDARPGLWWLSSFGAGFSAHGALLEVKPA